MEVRAHSASMVPYCDRPPEMRVVATLLRGQVRNDITFQGALLELDTHRLRALDPGCQRGRSPG